MTSKKRELAPIITLTRGEGVTIPLSFTQGRLWFVNQLNPDSPAYNVPLAVQLTGKLDRHALVRTLDEIIRRHEALRTKFVDIGGEPAQVIAPAGNNGSAPTRVALPLIDLSHMAVDEREAKAKTLVLEDARRPFDLAEGPLLRCSLVRLAHDEHILVVVMHHIVTDGWSLGIFLKELGVLYNSFTDGQASPLAELKTQYADYAQWQRGWLRGDVLEEHLTYWKRQLDGAPSLLEMPTDRPRPSVQSYKGKRQVLLVSKEVSEGLREMSLREGATLYMSLLAGFKALLYRYSGQTDIVVGTPVANRNRAEVEAIIGPLLNTLVMRTDLGGEPSFRELLKRVKKVALESYAHQDLPFDLLIEHMNVKRDLSYNPMFQVLFSTHKPPAETLKLSGVVASRIRINAETTKFDLNLTITEGEQGLWATLEYNTDLFEDESIARMLRHFERLLAGILARPDQPISELPLLSEAERHQLLIEWNDTAKNYSKEDCVHEMFEEQVARTPDRVAVVYGDEQLTYDQLNKCANRLANYLLLQGLLPEDKVAICVDRSIDMVVAVLAALKSGAAYLPLDPAYPAHRLAFMLDDSLASVLVTQERLLGLLPDHRAKLLCLDTEREAIAGQSEQDLPARITPENLAYVLYTSGSTGVPKGVQIPHRAVVNFINSMRELTGVRQEEVMLAVTTLSFDIAGLELYLPISVGARLEVASREEAADGERLRVRMRESGTTMMQATPASWRMLLQSGWGGDKGLKILCGGEALPKELAKELEEAGERVWNLYGPTETTIWSAADEVESAERGVSIGHPIANTQIYILDEHMEPVPIGVTGNIYIAGDGVGRGYLNLAEKTAEKFIPDHCSKQPGARMYETGDTGRYRADGKIRYEGRVDHQVKLRGYRIEPAEVEAILNQHAAVTESAVVVREDGAGEKRLVAYVVCGQMGEPKSSELREYLKERLPDYMVPSWYVMMRSFPLTPNGKVDRRALPAPEQMRRDREKSYVAPRNAVEEIVAGIWSQVLRVERVGVEDDFFELGGHSLLATQVVSRIRQAFQVEVPLQRVFESPTVAGLSARIDADRTPGESPHVFPITPVPRGQHLPTSFSQSREWFLQQLEPETYAYNIPSAIGLRGVLIIEALRQSINEIVRRHEALRTNFIEVDGQPVQVIKQKLVIDIPLVDLQGLSEFTCKSETRRLVRLEAQNPFDLAEDPLVRASVLRVAEDSHVLLLTMHHIVSDGWSKGIFERELETLYRSFACGENSPLADPSIQYADFACWQRQWLNSEVLDAQLAYWKQQLQAAPAVLELATDRPRPPVQTHRGATETLLLSKELSSKLKELSRRQAVTLYMTLLSAFNVLLCRYSNQTDILTGTYIANRNRGEIEGLIGFFVNTLVMRTDLSGNPTFRELLARVRKVTIEAFAHPDVPFEKLLESMQVERARSHTPLFQVMLVHQNAAPERLKLPGLEITPGALERTRANFDLTLMVQEKRQQLQAVFEYNIDLFDQQTVARMAGHFETLLEDIAASPEKRVSDLRLLTEAEQRRLLVEWSTNEKQYSDGVRIIETFEKQVRITPQKVAIVHNDSVITFGGLNERANRLADLIIGEGL